ncbi:MAG: flagellar export chaperone FliS [Planctomycetes bacterium]|nr:flagellar export chaperone FliS [Planctomycetota bacterium]
MNPARRYLETQVTTAPKEQLLLMLIDGALRFTRQARELTVARDVAAASTLYLKGQAIALELVAALDSGLEPRLRANLSGLYMFVFRKLVDANLKHETVHADEALQILEKLRAMWGDAVARMKSESAPVAAEKNPA